MLGVFKCFSLGPSGSSALSGKKGVSAFLTTEIMPLPLEGVSLRDIALTLRV